MSHSVRSRAGNLWIIILLFLFVYKVRLVPLAGVEPALLAELDFESSASTNSATGALSNQRTTSVLMKGIIISNPVSSSH